MKTQVEIQEPDKNKNIKRIIAREGLIGVIILFSGYLLYLIFIGETKYPSSAGTGYEFRYLSNNLIGLFTLNFMNFNLEFLFKEFISVYAFLGCPFYFLIRFIMWAVRTLREK